MVNIVVWLGFLSKIWKITFQVDFRKMNVIYR